MIEATNVSSIANLHWDRGGGGMGVGGVIPTGIIGY